MRTEPCSLHFPTASRAQPSGRAASGPGDTTSAPALGHAPAATSAWSPIAARAGRKVTASQSRWCDVDRPDLRNGAESPVTAERLQLAYLSVPGADDSAGRHFL